MIIINTRHTIWRNFPHIKHYFMLITNYHHKIRRRFCLGKFAFLGDTSLTVTPRNELICHGFYFPMLIWNIYVNKTFYTHSPYKRVTKRTKKSVRIQYQKSEHYPIIQITSANLLCSFIKLFKMCEKFNSIMATMLFIVFSIANLPELSECYPHGINVCFLCF